MSHSIKLMPVVHIDLRKAKKWYRDKSEILAAEFKEAVDKEIEYIRAYPEHYQKKIKSYDNL